MVKYSVLNNSQSSPRLRIPLKLIIFWYKKIKSYINTHNTNLINSKECPTLYISKKYPKMSILELYQRINNHLIKYFPKIHSQLNSNSNMKRCIVKLKKEKVNLKEKEKKENNEKDVKISNNEESNKTPYILINLGKKNENMEKIKSLNEKNCEKIKHLFESHKFDEKIYEKYNNCSVKEILIDDNENNNNDDKNNNDKNGSNDDDESSSSISIEDVRPIESTTYSSSNGFSNNKINYITHFKNVPRNSKYFNNDDYYSNKLKSIGVFNNNK